MSGKGVQEMKIAIIIVLLIWTVISIVLIRRAQRKANTYYAESLSHVRETDKLNEKIDGLKTANAELRENLSQIQPFQKTFSEKCRRGNWCERCEYGKQIRTDYTTYFKRETICSLLLPCEKFSKKC